MTYSESDFPGFELVKDNFGNSWVNNVNTHNYILTEQILKPGDLLVITAIARNTSREQLFYNFKLGFTNESFWQLEPCHTFEITQSHISKSIAAYVRISRKFKDTFIDLEENLIQFRYTVIAS